METEMTVINSQLIKMALVSSVNIVAMHSMNGYTNEFTRSQVKKGYEKIIKDMKEFFDWDNLTKEELIQAGSWSTGSADEEGKILYLIPLWMEPLIKDGQEFESVFGKKLVAGKDYLDLDCRYGCLSFGIRFK